MSLERGFGKNVDKETTAPARFNKPGSALRQQCRHFTFTTRHLFIFNKMTNAPYKHIKASVSFVRLLLLLVALEAAVLHMMR